MEGSQSVESKSGPTCKFVKNSPLSTDRIIGNRSAIQARSIGRGRDRNHDGALEPLGAASDRCDHKWIDGGTYLGRVPAHHPSQTTLAAVLAVDEKINQESKRDVPTAGQARVSEQSLREFKGGSELKHLENSWEDFFSRRVIGEGFKQ